MMVPIRGLSCTQVRSEAKPLSRQPSLGDEVWRPGLLGGGVGTHQCLAQRLKEPLLLTLVQPSGTVKDEGHGASAGGNVCSGEQTTGLSTRASAPARTPPPAVECQEVS